MKITLDQQIKCVRREIALRERVYPKWVREGKKKPYDAAFEIAAMKAVLKTLEDYDRVCSHASALETIDPLAGSGDYEG